MLEGVSSADAVRLDEASEGLGERVSRIGIEGVEAVGGIEAVGDERSVDAVGCMGVDAAADATSFTGTRSTMEA